MRNPLVCACSRHAASCYPRLHTVALRTLNTTSHILHEIPSPSTPSSTSAILPPNEPQDQLNRKRNAHTNTDTIHINTHQLNSHETNSNSNQIHNTPTTPTNNNIKTTTTTTTDKTHNRKSFSKSQRRPNPPEPPEPPESQSSKILESNLSQHQYTHKTESNNNNNNNFNKPRPNSNSPKHNSSSTRISSSSVSPSPSPSSSPQPPLNPEEAEKWQRFNKMCRGIRDGSVSFSEVTKTFAEDHEKTGRGSHFAFYGKAIVSLCCLQDSNLNTAWGTDTDLVMQEFYKIKPKLHIKDLESTYVRILYHLAYMRSTGVRNESICDSCISSMREDGISPDSIAYCAVLLHTDAERRAKVFAEMGHHNVACSTELVNLALASGDPACAIEGWKMLRGRPWIRARHTFGFARLLRLPTSPHVSEDADTPEDVSTPLSQVSSSSSSIPPPPPSPPSEITLAEHLVAQGDEATCAEFLYDLKAQGVKPPLMLLESLMQFAATRGDSSAVESLVAEMTNEGHPPTLDTFRQLLSSNDAWVRPSPSVVVIYAPPLPFPPPPPPPSPSSSSDLPLPPPPPPPSLTPPPPPPPSESIPLPSPASSVDIRALPEPPLSLLRSTRNQSANTPPPVQQIHADLPPSTIPTPPNARQVRRQHQQQKQQQSPSNNIQTQLRDYITKGDFVRAHELVRSSPGHPSTARHLYELLIIAAARARNAKLSLELLEEFAEREKVVMAAAGKQDPHATLSVKVRNVVMDVMVKSNHPHDAMKVFYALLERGLQPDTLTLNVAATAMRNAGTQEGVRRFFATLREINAQPAQHVYNCILTAAIAVTDVETYKSVFSDMESRNMRPERPTCTLLLLKLNDNPKMETEKMELATKASTWGVSLSSSPSSSSPSLLPSPPVFSLSPTPPNLQSYFEQCKKADKIEGQERKMAIEELRKHRDVLDEEFAKSNSTKDRIHIHEALLKLFKNVDDVEGEVREIKNKGIPLTRYSLNRLISYFSFVGKVPEMLKAKDELLASKLPPNTDTFIPILSLFIQRRDHASIAQISKELRAHSISPDGYLLLARGDAVAEIASRGDMVACEDLLRDITQSAGSAAATLAFNEGATKLAERGLTHTCVALARLVDAGVVQPDGMTFAALADGLSQDEAHKHDVPLLYQRAKHEDTQTPHALGEREYALFACAFARIDAGQCIAVLDEMAARGVEAKSATYMPLLAHFAKKRDVEGCAWVVRVMKERGVKRGIPFLRIQMGLVVSLEDINGGKALLKGINEDGIQISVYFINFYTGFLELLATHGEVSACLQLLNDLKLQHGAHALAKCGIYKRIYNALLASPRTCSLVASLVRKGSESSTQEVVEEVLKKAKAR